MNARQKNAAVRLEKALDACHKAGLSGGVYECGMYVWPSNADPNPRDVQAGFFTYVNEIGQRLFSLMSLDGGSGS